MGPRTSHLEFAKKPTSTWRLAILLGHLGLRLFVWQRWLEGSALTEYHFNQEIRQFEVLNHLISGSKLFTKPCWGPKLCVLDLGLMKNPWWNWRSSILCERCLVNTNSNGHNDITGRHQWAFLLFGLTQSLIKQTRVYQSWFGISEIIPTNPKANQTNKTAWVILWDLHSFPRPKLGYQKDHKVGTFWECGTIVFNHAFGGQYHFEPYPYGLPRANFVHIPWGWNKASAEVRDTRGPQW